MISSHESCWSRWWDRYQDNSVNIRMIFHSDWSPSADFYKLLTELQAMAMDGAIVTTIDGEFLQVEQVNENTFRLRRADGTTPNRFPYSDPRKRRGGISKFVFPRGHREF